MRYESLTNQHKYSRDARQCHRFVKKGQRRKKTTAPSRGPTPIPCYGSRFPVSQSLMAIHTLPARVSFASTSSRPNSAI